MSKAQTDNSFFADKVGLRLNVIPLRDISVLDGFAGCGSIWRMVRTRFPHEIRYVGLDKLPKSEEFIFLGDNTKTLADMDLDQFDVIDLDAYGVPFAQLEIIFDKGFKGILFVTFIQSVMGKLPHNMLSALGYSEDMVRKCPALFNRAGFEKFCNYLAFKGVNKITHRTKGRKSYIAFSMPPSLPDPS